MIVILSILSFFVAIFYVFFLNLSTDNIMLFLPNKLFLGQWLRHGILPLFNPYIFTGVPFAFDIGLGNLHLFNIFFTLPYPLSVSLWSFSVAMLYLAGFYLFFKSVGAKSWYAFILTIILFCSGSGFFIRYNNPTILAVIAHYGLFLYSFSFLKQRGFRKYIFVIISGLLMALAGHFQFVIYGYILATIVSLFIYKNSFKVNAFALVLSLFSISWYFILSLPMILTSTRLGSVGVDIYSGALKPQHILELFLPFIWGFAKNGSSWNAGPQSLVTISLTSMIGYCYLIFKKKSTLSLFIILAIIILSLGFIPVLLLRNPSQIIVLLHIFLLAILAQHEKEISSVLKNLHRYRKVLFIIFIAVVVITIFFFSPLFSKLFFMFFVILKKKPGLFYDLVTVQAIGQLIGLSLLSVGLFLLSLLAISFSQKKWQLLLLIFILVEAFVFNFFHNYFISTSLIPQKYEVSLNKNYRVQTAADVVPYFGMQTYVSSVLFRPPFSKEKSLITPEEENTRAYFKNLMSFMPPSWNMIYNISSVQGYNTFVPKRIAYLFNKPSDDYQKQYANILSRNALFGASENNSHTNFIETSRITLTDKRWNDLNVRYILSPMELKGMKLISKNQEMFMYEYPDTKSIFEIRNGTQSAVLQPNYFSPNEVRFLITNDTLGKTFIAHFNTSGFIFRLNNQSVACQQRSVSCEIKLMKTGTLKLSYSPIEHLKQVLKSQ